MKGNFALVTLCSGTIRLDGGLYVSTSIFAWLWAKDAMRREEANSIFFILTVVFWIANVSLNGVCFQHGIILSKS